MIDDRLIKEAIEQWLELPEEEKINECPFDHLVKCSEGGFELCCKIFPGFREKIGPNIIAPRCPCAYYSRKLVNAVAKFHVKRLGKKLNNDHRTKKSEFLDAIRELPLKDIRFIRAWVDFINNPEMEFENAELAGYISCGIVESVARFFFEKGRKEAKSKMG